MNNISQFFDAFPKIDYDINRDKVFEQTEHVTNIFFRIGILKKIINNISAYYPYTVKDSETPEIVAENNYGDANAGWIVIYTNQLFDPQFDWPLGHNALDSYVTEKYGSIQKAMQTVHHVEKVVMRRNLTWNSENETRHIITPVRLTDFPAGKPFDYYVWNQSLNPYPDGPDPNLKGISADTLYKLADSINLDDTVDRETLLTGGGLSVEGLQEYAEIDGDTIVTTTRADVITCYDYEFERNEKRRQIQVIKPLYYAQIMAEFQTITGTLPGHVRRLG